MTTMGQQLAVMSVMATRAGIRSAMLYGFNDKGELCSMGAREDGGDLAEIHKRIVAIHKAEQEGADDHSEERDDSDDKRVDTDFAAMFRDLADKIESGDQSAAMGAAHAMKAIIDSEETKEDLASAQKTKATLAELAESIDSGKCLGLVIIEEQQASNGVMHNLHVSFHRNLSGKTIYERMVLASNALNKYLNNV